MLSWSSLRRNKAACWGVMEGLDDGALCSYANSSSLTARPPMIPIHLTGSPCWQRADTYHHADAKQGVANLG